MPAADPSPPDASADSKSDEIGAPPGDESVAPTDDALAPHRAGLIFGLGVISLLCCAPLGILTVLLASADLQAMRQGRMDPSGETWTFRGKVFGIVALTVLAAEVVLLLVHAILRFGVGMG